MNKLKKLGLACVECGSIDNLTRHHLKNDDGKRNGKIKILCRECHDDAEEEYQILGIIRPIGGIKITPNEQLELDYMNGLLPYYSLGKKIPSVEDLCICDHKKGWHHGNQKQFDLNGKSYIRICYGLACTCEKFRLGNR